MKFIFPQNYDFKNKLFGIIDYMTAFINIVWCTFVLIIINLLFNSINFKIFLFIIFCFPVLLFSISGFHGENVVYVFSYIFKFALKPKLFFYNKKLN